MGWRSSVFIAGLFVLAARELAAIVGRRGEHEVEKRLQDAATTMATTIAEHGWDGAWFRRAYDFFGNPVGSSVCDEGQIFVESQGMCVMAGVGLEDGRARQALDSVRERLLTEHGVVLQQPAYSGYRIELGEISSYPPGYKENAGIFCHTNPWIMIAEAMTGDGDGAFEVYRRTNPSVREAISEVHRCEPYVYAQMIAGHDAPSHGEAKNSWLTGAAAWNYVAITQWILGIRPEREGLRIDPVIPAAWPGFTVTRRFRGSTFRIAVRKPEGGHRPGVPPGRRRHPGGGQPRAPRPRRSDGGGRGGHLSVGRRRPRRERPTLLRVGAPASPRILATMSRHRRRSLGPDFGYLPGRAAAATARPGSS